MRILPLFGCAILVELGWLAMWPLSGALSHSPRFTTALLEMHLLVRQSFDFTLQAAHAILPGLPDAPMTDPLGSAAYQVPAAALAAVMLWLGTTYVLTLVLLDRGVIGGRGAIWMVLTGAVLYQATLLFLPGLFSQDVFSYIAYGRIAAVYELNPYIWPPSVLRDPVVPWVAEVWRTYAAPYGPLWVGAQWLVGRTTNGLSMADQALVYRAIANVLLLANLGMAWRLLGRVVPLSPVQRTTAFAALAWNPLVLFEMAGNAHNDALMVSFSLLALLLFGRSSRGVASSAAFALATLVKYLAGLGLVWLTVASAARATNWTGRFVRVAVIGLVAVALAAICFAPWLELPDSFDPLLNETAGVGFVNSLPDTFALMLAARGAISVDTARGAERILAWAIFVVYLAWEARWVWSDPTRRGLALALTRSCLVYVLLVSTSFQTWYLCLPLSIATTLGWRNRLTQVTVAYGALAMPAVYLSYYLRENTPAWVFMVYGLGPLALLALRKQRVASTPARRESQVASAKL